MGVNRFSAAKLSRHNLSSNAWAGQSAGLARGESASVVTEHV
jgi:hypothetical protein